MDGYVEISTKLDTKDFTAEIKYIESQLEEIEEKLKQADMGFEIGDTQKLEARYSRLIKQLDRLQKKQADLNKTNLEKIKEAIENISDSVGKTISKVGRWALAIFGIRSAYNFLRQSASTLAQYNDQIASDLEYMRFAIASMLQPAIEGMIQLAYKLLTYISYIAKAWFGVDLFANASTKAMEKGVKSAEKMKKSLAGFDEMNVLNDNGTTGAMGAVAPSVDLSAPEDIPIPEWIQWIADNKDILIAGLLGISGGLMAIQFGLTLIQGLGIGIALEGLVLIIQSLIKFLNDPTFENFTNIISGIGIAIIGVGIIISSIPVIVAGIIATIVTLIVQNYDFILGLFNKLIKWFENDFVGALHYLFGPIGDIIAQPFIFAINYIKGMFEGVFGGIKKIVDGIVLMFKGDFKNGLKQAFGGLKDILLAPFNAMVSGINSLIRGINKIKFDIPSWLGGGHFGINIPEIPRLAVGGIVNMPGRGINYGGANIAERGAEGVIPLTNSQAMETLGEAIGRYVTINANITNSMNGRVISRELKKVNASNDFAYNR